MSSDILDTFWAKGMLDRQRASFGEVVDAQARCIAIADAKIDELVGYCGVANDRIAALDAEKAALTRKVLSHQADLVRLHEGYVRDRASIEAHFAREWERRRLEVQREKAVILGEREGIRAQRDALSAELSRAEPDNALLVPTGRTYDSGEVELGIDGIYAEGHAAAMTQMGFPPEESVEPATADQPRA